MRSFTLIWVWEASWVLVGREPMDHQCWVVDVRHFHRRLMHAGGEEEEGGRRRQGDADGRLCIAMMMREHLLSIERNYDTRIVRLDQHLLLESSSISWSKLCKTTSGQFE